MFVTTFSFSQSKSKEPVFNQWKEHNTSKKYDASSEFDGPSQSTFVSPKSIKEDEQIQQQGTSPNRQNYQGSSYSQNQIQQGRQIGSSNSNRGVKNGAGSVRKNARVKHAKPIEFDPPNIKTPQINRPNVGNDFWLIFGIILLLIVIAVIIYFIVKNNNSNQENKSVPFKELSEDINPETISKTELELRLEEAIASENYKECVRIYFLFAMKECIDRKYIFWKKEKTNFQYLIEMRGKNGAGSFEEIVKWYDLVWYGDYTLDKVSYSAIEPLIHHAYKTLENHA